MTAPRHRTLSVALVAALALVTAACGSDTEEPAVAPTAEDTLPPDDGGDAAGGTTMRVHSVTEAMAAEGEGSLHVVGLLIDDGSGWRLCEAVLESYPPQCGGESLAVEGLDEGSLPLEESGDVRWQTDATVVGEVEGDTLTVTGSPASS